LHKNRTVPVKPFESITVDTCDNITSVKQRSTFFKKYKNKGVRLLINFYHAMHDNKFISAAIYIFQFKNNTNIYYIGRTNNFKKRFKAHLNTSGHGTAALRKDKFHLFANLIGWNNFNFSIVEICDTSIQQLRENYYLNEYSPLLNTILKSNLNEFQINKGLYLKLKEKQGKIKQALLRLKRTLCQPEGVLSKRQIYKGITIYAYGYSNGKISKNFKKYNSINNLNKDIKISRSTIKMYLNTHCAC
jgi:hypothetical protein